MGVMGTTETAITPRGMDTIQMGTPTTNLTTVIAVMGTVTRLTTAGITPLGVTVSIYPSGITGNMETATLTPGHTVAGTETIPEYKNNTIIIEITDFDDAIKNSNQAPKNRSLTISAT